MSGRRLGSRLVASLAVMLLLPASVPAQEPSSGAADGDRPAAKPSQEDARLAMTKAKACLSIDGYQKYELLPGAKLTADEKLLIYYEPLNYKTVVKEGKFVIHMTQDGQIRRKGEKAVLRKKKNILDYEDKNETGFGWVCLRNSVALKGLPPGEYEYDIILRDEQNPGATATQTLSFRIVAAVMPKAE
ncbi:hypothetical protein [Aquisphaera insulae]|uniref:hypothetical protein n=1 Tax=Aquisphaera insulae TaxID=2712864 RepID=UPI0013EB70AC|nr:hypothetical protein [Aquisphaera insulae]